LFSTKERKKGRGQQSFHMERVAMVNQNKGTVVLPKHLQMDSIDESAS